MCWPLRLTPTLSSGPCRAGPVQQQIPCGSDGQSFQHLLLPSPALQRLPWMKDQGEAAQRVMGVCCPPLLTWASQSLRLLSLGSG